MTIRARGRSLIYFLFPQNLILVYDVLALAATGIRAVRFDWFSLADAAEISRPDPAAANVHLTMLRGLL